MKKNFLKDKKAIICKKESGEDTGFGAPDIGYRLISPSPLWCYAKQLSQQLIFQAAQWGQQEQRLFVFNYNEKITVQDTYIRYRDVWYQVTRVDTEEDYKGDMFVYVKAVDRKKASTFEILPYIG